MKKLNYTSQKGITLIALIITIIVMLILVGVTINVALNGGLFGKAEYASEQMQIKAEEEELLAAVIAAIGTDTKIDFDYLDDNYHNFRKFVFSHWGKSLDELSREECIFYKQCYLKELGITSRLKSNKHNENYDEILYNMSPYRYIQYGDEDALQFASDEVLNAAHKGNKEIKDYTNRNYEYQKGKGWVKKQK